MSWLIVTPARHELERLPELARSLEAQTARDLIGLWVVVDDSGKPGTDECLARLAIEIPYRCVTRPGGEGLAGGGAFRSFMYGVDVGLAEEPDAERVMKLDADIVLAPDHLEVLATAPPAGLVGGVLVGADEQARCHHVRGALKVYSRPALELVRQIPPALGFDVLDEVAVRTAGMEVRVIPEATARVTRRTGTSEGVIAGKLRAGVVSRWTGYHPVYFALRLARMSLERPTVLGALAALWGWARAGRGPYPAHLRRALKREQSRRILGALRGVVRRPPRPIG